MLENYRSDARAGIDGREQRPSMVASVDVPDYFARKAIWMRLLAAVLLVPLLPIMLVLMLLVRLTSPGPALFQQNRLGRDGREFELLKIRTMYRDAEAISGPALCQPGDSRITPLGRCLRFLHLDELPQLINVVRGDMCLVGPRPERPEIIARNKLHEIVPGFDERTRVSPGVTGLAQINLPADVDAAAVIPKVKLDLEYIETASAWLDLRILACTALRMLGVRHGRAVRLLGLGRSAQVGADETKRPVVYSWVDSGRPRKTLAHGSRPGTIPVLAIAASFTASDNTDSDEEKHTPNRSSFVTESSHKPR